MGTVFDDLHGAVFIAAVKEIRVFHPVAGGHIAVEGAVARVNVRVVSRRAGAAARTAGAVAARTGIITVADPVFIRRFQRGEQGGVRDLRLRVGAVFDDVALSERLRGRGKGQTAEQREQHQQR